MLKLENGAIGKEMVCDVKEKPEPLRRWKYCNNVNTCDVAQNN